MFNKLANAAAICSLASTAVEAGKRGVRKAKANSKHELVVKDIRDYTGDSKLNEASDKHNAMKNMIREGDYFASLYKAKGAITGFAKGVYEGMRPNLVSTAFAISTLVAKGRIPKMIGITGCAISTVWDFLKNGTNLFTNKDTIEK